MFFVGSVGLWLGEGSYFPYYRSVFSILNIEIKENVGFYKYPSKFPSYNSLHILLTKGNHYFVNNKLFGNVVNLINHELEVNSVDWS